MKTRSFVCWVCLTTLHLLWAAESPTELLQQGLLEEEANHNLEAAIQAYQSVLDQFEDQRRLGATAAFRLGECYRKLSRTNEAVAQYERILREFADQETLATLSRQNLAGLGQPAAETRATGDVYVVQPGDTLSGIVAAYRQNGVEVTLDNLLRANPGLTPNRLQAGQRLVVPGGHGGLLSSVAGRFGSQPAADPLASLRAEYALLSAQVKETMKRIHRTGDLDRRAALVQTAFNDSQLAKLVEEKLSEEQTLARSRETHAEDDPVVRTLSKGLETLSEQIEDRILIILDGQQARLNALRTAIDSSGPGLLPGSVAEGQLKLSLEGLKQQKELLAQELALVQGDLDRKRKLVEDGRLATAELVSSQREVLSLQRQLAAVEDAIQNQPRWLTLDLPDQAAGPSAFDPQEIERLKRMLENSPDLINARDAGGETPLGKAAKEGKLAVVEFLITHGAAINGASAKGETALHVAAQEGHKAMVELLLEKGADLNAKDGNSQTPLHLAAAKGFRTVAEVLLAKGADLNAKDKGGLTPLHRAALAGERVVDLLIAHKADVNAVDHLGNTPLFYAARNSGLEVNRALLAAGANPNVNSSSIGMRLDLPESLRNTLAPDVPSHNNWTPLLMAVHNKNRALASLLLENGADPSLASSLRWTSLHEAVNQHDLPMAELLLARGQRSMPRPTGNRSRRSVWPFLRGSQTW